MISRGLLAGVLWIPVTVLVMASCATENDRYARKELQIRLVAMSIDPSRPFTSVASGPISDASVVLVQGRYQAVVSVGEDGTARFSGGSGIELGAAVDLFIDSGPERIAVLSVTLPTITIPIRTVIEDPRTVADAWRRIELRITDWIQSAIGQRSEAYVVLRERSDVRVPDALQSLADAYATASFFSGSGSVECVCVGGAGEACQGGAVECRDSGGFASGASGVTLFAATDQVELGFIERVTRTADGSFVETGRMFYDPAFPMPGTGTIRQIVAPDLDPDLDYCGNDGRAVFELGDLPREFIRAERDGYGLRLWLWLVSPAGLRMPLLTGASIPAETVSPRGGDQIYFWKYPFVSSLPEGFSYEVSAQAAVTRAADIVETVSLARTGIRPEDVCSVLLPLHASGPLAFVVPESSGMEGIDLHELQWLSGGEPLKRLRWKTQQKNFTVWMLDSAQAGLERPFFTEWIGAQPVTGPVELAVWHVFPQPGDLSVMTGPPLREATRTLTIDR